MSGGGVFRKKSLARLSSPERLDHLLEVVDRKTWIPLCTLGLLLAALVIWAVVATVPIHVEGSGILVRPRKIVEFESPGAGRVVRLEVAIGDEVRRGQLLAKIERPDLDARLALQRGKAEDLMRENLAAAPRIAGEPAGEPTTLRDYLDRSLTLAETLRRERQAALDEAERRIEAQQRFAAELSEDLRERRDRQLELREKQLVSDLEVDAAQEEYMESLERLFDVETQRGELQTARLEADEQYHDRRQRIAEWTFDLERQIADVEREIERLERQIHDEGHVFCDHDARILELNAAVGTFLAAGERLGAMEVHDPEAELKSVTYFRVSDGKRLKPRMTIRITPDTVDRERFGSVRGTVTQVSSYPVSLEEAARVVGNAVLARTLIEGGYLIQVTSKLERSEEHPERYDWGSSRGPDPSYFSPGTTTTARVAVEREKPIAFVLPLLKSAAGLD